MLIAQTEQHEHCNCKNNNGKFPNDKNDTSSTDEMKLLIKNKINTIMKIYLGHRNLFM